MVIVKVFKINQILIFCSIIFYISLVTIGLPSSHLLENTIPSSFSRCGSYGVVEKNRTRKSNDYLKCGKYYVPWDNFNKRIKYSFHNMYACHIKGKGGTFSVNQKNGKYRIETLNGVLIDISNGQCQFFSKGKLRDYIKVGNKTLNDNSLDFKYSAAFNNFKKDNRKFIQRHLSSLSFYSGKIDGLYGLKTENAIEKYAQSLAKSNHLKSEKLTKELLQTLLASKEPPETVEKVEPVKKQIITELKVEPEVEDKPEVTTIAEPEKKEPKVSPTIKPKIEKYVCSSKNGTSKILILSSLENEVLGYVSEADSVTKEKVGYILQKENKVFIGQKKDLPEFLRFEAPSKLELMSSSSAWKGECILKNDLLVNKTDEKQSIEPELVTKLPEVSDPSKPAIQSFSCYDNDNLMKSLVLASFQNEVLGFVLLSSSNKLDEAVYDLKKEDQVYIGKRKNSSAFLRFELPNKLELSSSQETWQASCEVNKGSTAMIIQKVYQDMFEKKDFVFNNQKPTKDTSSVKNVCSKTTPFFCKSKELCNLATKENEWNMKSIEFVNEAKNRGLTCGIIEYDSVQMSSVFKSLPLGQRQHVQAALKNLGFYSKLIDGLWGPETNKAVKKYVTKKDLQILTSIDYGAKKIFTAIRDNFDYVPPKIKTTQKHRKLVSNPLFSYEEALSLCKPQANYAENQVKSNMSGSGGCVGSNYFFNSNCHNSNASILRSIGNNLSAISAGRDAYYSILRRCMAQIGWVLN